MRQAQCSVRVSILSFPGSVLLGGRPVLPQGFEFMPDLEVDALPVLFPCIPRGAHVGLSSQRHPSPLLFGQLCFLPRQLGCAIPVFEFALVYIIVALPCFVFPALLPGGHLFRQDPLVQAFRIMHFVFHISFAILAPSVTSPQFEDVLDALTIGPPVYCPHRLRPVLRVASPASFASALPWSLVPLVTALGVFRGHHKCMRHRCVWW